MSRLPAQPAQPAQPARIRCSRAVAGASGSPCARLDDLNGRGRRGPSPFTKAPVERAATKQRPRLARLAVVLSIRVARLVSMCQSGNRKNLFADDPQALWRATEEFCPVGNGRWCPSRGLAGLHAARNQ